MDDIQIPDSCSSDQFLSILKYIDAETSLSDQNKQWLKAKLTEKYMVLVAKSAVKKGISGGKLMEEPEPFTGCKKIKLDSYLQGVVESGFKYT